MNPPSKGTAVDTTNIQPGELISMDLPFYNVSSIRGFTSMINFVFEETIMIWVFTTASKQPPVYIIHFILTTLKNEQHPQKNVRFNENGALENSENVTKFLVYGFNTSMETTGGDESYLNGKNEI